MPTSQNDQKLAMTPTRVQSCRVTSVSIELVFSLSNELKGARGDCQKVRARSVNGVVGRDLE